MRRLIVTADDFGLAVPVNDAVERAHRDGILTHASLMMGAPAVDDAVARARRLPTLQVGLHLVLVDGRPVLPPEAIPDLVGDDGRFTGDPVAIGIRIALFPRVRRQAAAEVRAQFEAFRATGLPLAHVDGHHHFHQHPSISRMLLSLTHEFAIPRVRVPREPFLTSWRAQRHAPWRRLVNRIASANRLRTMDARLRRAGIACPDAIFGLADSGAMDAATISRFLDHLPPGLTEIYCHPAVRRWTGRDNLPADYRCIDEFSALVDPAVVAKVAGLGLGRG